MTVSWIAGVLITINIFTYFFLLDYFVKQTLTWELQGWNYDFLIYIIELPSNVTHF